ncbi:MAG: FMN-binding protein [Spirochaetia bacterium]
MKELPIIGGKLALICAVAAITLGIVNAVTEPVIEMRRQQDLENALQALMEGNIGVKEEVDSDSVVQGFYPISDDFGDLQGVILDMTGNGYAGDMRILAAYNGEGEILSAQLMENQETPGLGKEAEAPEYMEMFVGTGGDVPVPTSKAMLPPEDADAISGASITFMGIGNALESGSEYVKNNLEDRFYD